MTLHIEQSVTIIDTDSFERKTTQVVRRVEVVSAAPSEEETSSRLCSMESNYINQCEVSSDLYLVLFKLSIIEYAFIIFNIIPYLI